MSDETKMELIEELFDVDTGSLSPNMELDSIDEWGSLTKLSLVVMLDDECGVIINDEVISTLKTVRDIMDLMD